MAILGLLDPQNIAAPSIPDALDNPSKSSLLRLLILQSNPLAHLRGIAPNLHFPYLHRNQIYTNPRFTRDPYLHSPDLHKSLSAHRFQQTQIYTKSQFTQRNFAQNPNLHKTFSSNFAQTISDSIIKKRLCSRSVRGVAAHRTTCILPRNVGVSNYIQVNSGQFKKRLLRPVAASRAALEVQPHMKQHGFHPELQVSQIIVLDHHARCTLRSTTGKVSNTV